MKNHLPEVSANVDNITLNSERMLAITQNQANRGAEMENPSVQSEQVITRQDKPGSIFDRFSFFILGKYYQPKENSGDNNHFNID